ncbi:MAG TPA: DUF4956 domain-containing protein [Thermomicrobiales bacterium]|nr:DUF4956 domain-containing protein [Thermomicrobiales bacterium]
MTLASFPFMALTMQAAAADTPSLLADFLLNLGINLVAIVLMAYGIYFRRHGRRDLLMVYISFNVGLFIVLSLITLNEATMAVGFGLFAILSLIRLRSEPFSNIELGYFFFAMAFAIVNAMQVDGTLFDREQQTFMLLLNAIALITLYIADHPSLQRGTAYSQLVLDRVFSNDADLEQYLETRLKAQIIEYSITRIDYVQEITTLEVRYIRLESVRISGRAGTIPTGESHA